MKISIIVCTFNRCLSLRETLRALKRQTVFRGGAYADGLSKISSQTQKTDAVDCEILIVDNNSSDNTKQIVNAESGDSKVPIRYLFEKRQGKSFALNAGIAGARGEYLLFTDDDILPEADWAEKMVTAFTTYRADCVGGKVLPAWEGKTPDYYEHPRLKKNFRAIWALLDHGDLVMEADEVDENFLYGCNIGIKKEVFGTLGVYRTDLGPCGNALTRGEDTEMMKRILTAGKKVLYSPEVVVKHKIEKDRLSLSYARRRRFDGGRSNVRSFEGPKKDKVPFWFIKECFLNGLSSIGAYCSGDRLAAIERELLFWTQLGQIYGGLSRQWKKTLS